MIDPPKPLAWRDQLAPDEIAGEYWDVPIAMGHSGGHYPPYDMNALMMAYQHENVYLDTSKSRTDVIEKAVSEIGAPHVFAPAQCSVASQSGLGGGYG